MCSSAKNCDKNQILFLLIVKIAFDLTLVNQVTQIGLFSLQIGANIIQIQYPTL